MNANEPDGPEAGSRSRDDSEIEDYLDDFMLGLCNPRVGKILKRVPGHRNTVSFDNYVFRVFCRFEPTIKVTFETFLVTEVVRIPREGKRSESSIQLTGVGPRGKESIEIYSRADIPEILDLILSTRPIVGSIVLGTMLLIALPTVVLPDLVKHRWWKWKARKRNVER